MNFYLPTREECQEIVSRTEAFYCTKREVQGFEIELYDYRLASYTDYVDNNAFELRGLCFVNNNGTWERNILMQKFFNLNETRDWMYEDVKDKKVDMVQVKEDGSVISFIKLPNGNVVAKSKMSFVSDQAIMAQEIYDNNEVIRNFINCCLDQNLVPVFELVSPFNQIVLVYNDTQLRLLQVRDNNTGKYLNIYEIKTLIEPFKCIIIAQALDMAKINDILKLYNKEQLLQKLEESKFFSFDDLLDYLHYK